MQPPSFKEEAPPDERFGAEMDRWEPGSDFESKSLAASQLRGGEAAASGAHESAAQPLQHASGNGGSVIPFAEAAAGAGPALSRFGAPDSSVHRLDLCLTFILLCGIELVSRRLYAAVCGADRMVKCAVC